MQKSAFCRLLTPHEQHVEQRSNSALLMWFLFGITQFFFDLVKKNVFLRYISFCPSNIYKIVSMFVSTFTIFFNSTIGLPSPVTVMCGNSSPTSRQFCVSTFTKTFFIHCNIITFNANEISILHHVPRCIVSAEWRYVCEVISYAITWSLFLFCLPIFVGTISIRFVICWKQKCNF